MGRFLNMGNEKFAELAQTKYFVDKTELIGKLLRSDITSKFICNSRARRFGKSVTADMLVAYFSKGADSRELFAPLKCEKDALFFANMNAFDTIFVDIQAIYKEAEYESSEPSRYMNRVIVQELSKAYPELITSEMSLFAAVSTVNVETGGQFVVIFDEWDYPIRELDADDPERKAYVEFLRGLFKSSAAKSYIRLAYLTGIMPVVRTRGQSAVNNFKEYTMVNAKDMGRYIGFTEEEVQRLCEKFHVDFEQMKSWYNGYLLSGEAMYNPLSVLNAIEDHDFMQYWTTTGSYEDIDDLISRNFDGLREDILKMLSGNRVFIDVSSGKNDLRTFLNKDEVITALIHLGYFAYDGRTREAYVPNKEIQAVFYKYMKINRNDDLSRFLAQSGELLDALLDRNGEEVAKRIQSIHNDFIPSITYNNENSLACTVTTALIAAFSYYQRPIREFPCGKGFADIVYLPLPQYQDSPAIVVELKWNKNAHTAIAQIRNRQYPTSLESYAGEVLLAGITYDKKTREHTCIIEGV